MSGPPPTLAVEEIGAGDLEEIAELERHCLPDPWTRADLTLYFGSGALAGWRLVERTEPAATLAFALFQLLPGEAELLRLGVLPERRRGGLGRLLLADCLARLAATGRPDCHLEVRAGNLAARALYERLGFRLAGRRRGYYSDGEDAVRYARREGSGVG
jgi:ribosomal-protein-alanine N-acetyltransferase